MLERVKALWSRLYDWSAQIVREWLVKARRVLPVGTRLPVGIILMVLGVFGFLPVIGFWMLPLGAAIAWLDLKPMLGWITGRFRG